LDIIKVNHVLSSHFFASGIFEDICQRFIDNAPGDMTVTVSPYRLPGQHVYHFHRPNRECRLPPNAVVTAHHDFDDPDPWLAFELFLPRYREARHVVCLNGRQRDRLSALGLAKLSIIRHGADKRLLPRKEASPASLRPLRIGVFSRRFWSGVKGETALTSLLRRLDPADFAFVFAGGGRWREAEAARRLGYQCEHYEAPPYGVLAALYRSIDALLVLSRHEGGPASLPEALHSGTPVLATAVGMVPDMVHDGENGLILAGDAERDAERLRALAHDAALLARLRAGALATEVADWSEVLARYYALYRTFAADERQAA
jgi:glycosyltransferase involved in cell wall biosynthesis